MDIYLFKNNEKHGPFEESTVTEWLRSGRCSLDDLAWRDGMETCQPLYTFYLSPYVGQAAGSSALMFQPSTPVPDSAQPPGRIKKFSAIAGFFFMALGGVGCLLGGFLTLSVYGLVFGLPLLVISLPITWLGVVLVRRA